MLYMKKFMLKGMAALAVCAAFASCSKDDGFETASNPAELAKIQYKNAFEKKYGAIDPNQTWDFTTSMFDETSSARTRATTKDVYALLSEWTEGYVHFSEISFLTTGWTEKMWNKDKEFLAANVNSSRYPVLDWEPHISGCLKAWAFFSHGNGDTNGTRWYRLGVHTEDANGSTNTTVIKGKTKASLWYTGYRQTVNGAGYIIDTRNLRNADKAYWYAIVTNGNGEDNYEVDEEANKLTKYKVVTADGNGCSGSVYWCFSCDGNDDYTDLILMVEPVVVSKRYMIEDLGSIGDFDFNDVVVDVYQTTIVSETSNAVTYNTNAIVRAMGGTKDFTLTIGSTTWSKSEHGYTPSVMENTSSPIDFNKEYDNFTVNNWHPDQNDITVQVNGGQNEDVYTVKFPKAGEAPMIIAVDPIRKWMTESQSVPSDWFYVPENN